MKISSNLFLIKTNKIYLTKLKKNIDLMASKFSSILTKDVYTRLKNKLFEQYNNIEAYVKKYTKLIEFYTKGFIELLNDS